MEKSLDGGSQDAGSGPPPGAVVVHRRLMTLDAKGVPVLTTTALIAKKDVEDMSTAVLALPYYDPIGLEPEFAGMTNLEVMMMRRARKAALGSSDETEKLLDRVLGKPKQSSEIKSLTLGYEDYLKIKAAEANKAESSPQSEIIQAEVVPAEVVPSDPFQDALGILG